MEQQVSSTQEIMEKLQAPFPAEDIEWRVNRVLKTNNGPKAIVLAYVTNRAIQSRFDEIFGPFGWQNEFQEWRDKGVLCKISVNFNGTWVSRCDGADATNVESTKGGFSAAMKRAAVQFGVGRYLYRLEECWVDIKDRGQNYINDKSGVKGYWDNPQLPSWALPTNQGNYQNNVKQLPVQNKTNQQNTTKQQPTKKTNQFKSREEKIGYIAEREVILNLKDEHKLKIFKQVNASSDIQKVADIYTKANDVQLNNYLYAIKPASVIKELATRSKMEEYVLNYLSGQMNKQLKSYLGLVATASNKTVKVVHDLITKAQKTA